MERTRLNINANNGVEDTKPPGPVHKQQMTKIYAPPYSHPGQKLKRMWIYSSATKKSGAKNTDSDASHQSVGISSQKILSVSQDLRHTTKPTTAFRCSQGIENTSAECNALYGDIEAPAGSEIISDDLTQNGKVGDTAIARTETNLKASNLGNISLGNGDFQSNLLEKNTRSRSNSASIDSTPHTCRKRQMTRQRFTKATPQSSQIVSHEIQDDSFPVKVEKLKPTAHDYEDKNLLHELELKENVRKMTEEIMRYEIRIASLYGRMVETNRENEILRKHNKIFDEKGSGSNADILKNAENEARSFTDDKDNPTPALKENLEQTATVNENPSFESKNCVAFEKPDDRSPLTAYSQSPIKRRLTSSNEKYEKMENMQHEKDATLKKKLELLESRIIIRLQEYEQAQLSLKENTESLEKKGSGHDITLSEESPFIKELKQKLIHGSNELRKVRRFANVRVNNMKVALESEKLAMKNLKKDYEQSKLSVRKSATYIIQANRYLKKYQKTIEEQRGVIISLRHKSNETIKVEPDDKNAYVIRKATDLAHKHNRMATEYASLIKVSNIQKNDITILNQHLDEEKLKSASLMIIVDQQRKELAEFRKTSGKLSDENALEKLSKSYDNLCQQRKEDEQLYQNRIKHLHKMYRMLLKNKESENQSYMENMVKELEDLRKLNNASKHPTDTRRGDVLIEKSQNQQKEHSTKDFDIFPTDSLKSEEEDSNPKEAVLLLNRPPLRK